MLGCFNLVITLFVPEKPRNIDLTFNHPHPHGQFYLKSFNIFFTGPKFVRSRFDENCIVRKNNNYNSTIT